MHVIDKIFKIDKSEKSTIRLCNDCGGTGKVFCNEFGSGPSDMVQCKTCYGTGRVKIIRAECDVIVPFDFDLPD